jgi:surface antigen
VRVGGAALPRDVVLARPPEARKELGRCHRAERRRVTEGPSRARRPTPSLARVPWPFPLWRRPSDSDRPPTAPLPSRPCREPPSSDRRWRQVPDFPRDGEAGEGVGLRVRVGGAALPRDVVLARRLEASKELGPYHRAERRRVTEGPARARRPTPSLARVPWTSPCRAAPLTPSADRRLPSSVPGSRRAELRSSDRRWRQVSDFPRDSKAGEGVGLRVRVGGAALPRDVVLARRLEASKELAELRRGPPAREGPPPPSRGCRGPSPCRAASPRLTLERRSCPSRCTPLRGIAPPGAAPRPSTGLRRSTPPGRRSSDRRWRQVSDFPRDSKAGEGVGLRVRVGGAALPRDVVLARRLEASKELGRCHRAERRRVTEGPTRARRPTPSLARVPWTSPCRAAPLTPSADRRLPSSMPSSRRAELRSSDRRWRQVSDFPRDSKAGEGVGLRVRVGGAALPRDVVLARRPEASKELGPCHRAERRRVTEGPARARRPTPSLARVTWTSPGSCPLPPPPPPPSRPTVAAGEPSARREAQNPEA